MLQLQDVAGSMVLVAWKVFFFLVGDAKFNQILVNGLKKHVHSILMFNRLGASLVKNKSHTKDSNLSFS